MKTFTEYDVLLSNGRTPAHILEKFDSDELISQDSDEIGDNGLFVPTAH